MQRAVWGGLRYGSEREGTSMSSTDNLAPGTNTYLTLIQLVQHQDHFVVNNIKWRRETDSIQSAL